MSQKQKDNMYPWVDRKRNFIGGACPHACSYCYVNKFKSRWAAVRDRYSGRPRLLEGELRKGEGSGHMIFVQDCGDLFAEAIPSRHIQRVLEHCCEHPDNTYLFQTKNPRRFKEFEDAFPPDVLLGITLESNRHYPEISKAPPPSQRIAWLAKMPHLKMVSIEPILDFDLKRMLTAIKKLSPRFVSIGADSKGYGLVEPHPDKIEALIEGLEEITEVRLKDNLCRLIG